MTPEETARQRIDAMLPHWNKWRPKYNWYLSNALNVGLLPGESNSKPTPGQDLDRFARSLREIVGLAKANPHAVLTSRYVRLPAGVSFKAENHATLFGLYSCEPIPH